MDFALLVFFNKTLAHPVLDVMVIGVTIGIYFILPGAAIFAFMKQQQQIGQAILIAILITFVLSWFFQIFALSPRPVDVRLIWPQPNFPSFPSGHTAAAFAVAAVVSLSFRQLRLQIMVFAVAVLIGLSRMYLGLHFFSDIFGGAVLGASVGAACFGLLVSQATGFQKWRWFLWLQIAIVIILTQMSYLDLPPDHKFAFKHTDKIAHFFLFGAVTFWLNIWLNGRRKSILQVNIPIAILLPFVLAFIEEAVQFFSPYRTLSLTDLLSDLAGMLCFWWLSEKLLKYWKANIYVESKTKQLETISE